MLLVLVLKVESIYLCKGLENNDRLTTSEACYQGSSAVK